MREQAATANAVEHTSNSTIATSGLGNIPLPGLSKTVWNATFCYEHGGFSARAATRSRSKYIGAITNFSNHRTFQYVKGNVITDFQTGYEFQEGALKGPSVLFQVNNIGNEPYVAYQTCGKQFFLGLNYKR